MSLFIKKAITPTSAPLAPVAMPCCLLRMGIVNKDGAAIYKYLNFNQIEEYVENAKGVAA